MVVAVLPAVRTGEIKRRISRRSPSWVECYRFLPHVTRERRIALVHGIGCGRVSIGLVATVVGFELAANPMQTIGSAILLLTPLSSLFCNRAQLETACRRAGPGARPRVLPDRRALQQRPRHPAQRGGGGQHRFWRAQMAGGATSEFFGDWHALLLFLLSGVIPNQIRRMLGPCSSAAELTKAPTS